MRTDYSNENTHTAQDSRCLILSSDCSHKHKLLGMRKYSSIATEHTMKLKL